MINFKLLQVFILGLSSGFPAPLAASTMQAYLLDMGVPLATLGFFMMFAICYNLKPLWAPLLDKFFPPLLANLLGKRRSWIVVCQLILAAIFYMASLLPQAAPLYLLGLLCFVICASSATQDIAIDAWRVELLKDEEQSNGAAVAVFACRMAGIVSGAGALFIAHHYGWQTTYQLIAFLMMMLLVLNVLVCTENTFCPRLAKEVDFKSLYLDPLREMLSRPSAWYILIILLFYKLSDALSASMTMPFLHFIGFNKAEIAEVVKLYGFIASMAGFLAGGLLIKRYNYYFGLLVGLIMEITSNFGLVVQAIKGYDMTTLMITIATENFCAGASGAALAAFVAHLCNKDMTASQYAAFSAITFVGRTIIAPQSGMLASHVGWSNFFTISAFASVPALLCLLWVGKSINLVQQR